MSGEGLTAGEATPFSGYFSGSMVSKEKRWVEQLVERMDGEGALARRLGLAMRFESEMRLWKDVERTLLCDACR